MCSGCFVLYKFNFRCHILHLCIELNRMSCTTCPTTSCTCCHVPNVLIDNNLTVNQTASITACGNSGNALIVNQSATCTQTSGDLMQINGEPGQSALNVVKGSVTIGDGNVSLTSGHLTLDSGDIVVSNGNVSTSSDAMLKTNIQPIINALNIVEKLEGVRFDWKNSNTHSDKRNIGLIAQSVQQVVPEVVGEHNGHLTVAYGQLVGVLIEAVKELSIQVNDLKDTQKSSQHIT